MSDPVPSKQADQARIAKKIERFISDYVEASSAKGIVIGLSGGLDSAVVAKLAVNSLGSERVLALILPASATPEQDVSDAADLAKSLGMPYSTINIDPIIERYSQALPADERAAGNLAARIRMGILYYHAAIRGYLVAGTSDKSERMIGYFTKFGDGAADLLPIADLYKTEVRMLASFLKIPKEIVEKKSSPRLWKDHLAEQEIGLSYDELDPILRLLEKKMSAASIARRLKIPLGEAKKVEGLVKKSAHKRRPTPFAKMS